MVQLIKSSKWMQREEYEMPKLSWNQAGGRRNSEYVYYAIRNGCTLNDRVEQMCISKWKQTDFRLNNANSVRCSSSEYVQWVCWRHSSAVVYIFNWRRDSWPLASMITIFASSLASTLVSLLQKSFQKKKKKMQLNKKTNDIKIPTAKICW